MNRLPANYDDWRTRAPADICPVCGVEHCNGLLCDDHQHWKECEECGELTAPEEWVKEYRCCVGCYERWYKEDKE